MSESDDKYLTAKEVAAKLQVSANTVYRWFVEGKLKGIKTGKKIAVSESSNHHSILSSKKRKKLLRVYDFIVWLNRERI